MTICRSAPLFRQQAQALVWRSETILAPRAFVDLVGAAWARGDGYLHKELCASYTWGILRSAGKPAHFDVVQGDQPFPIFRSGTGSGRLIVGFGGGSDRLMMPLPVFLQNMPQDTDLLLLKDPHKNHYRHDIWKGAGSMADLVRTLRSVMDRYADVVAFGSSYGGFPAVRFAKLAGLRRGISVGGRGIDDTMRIMRGGSVPDAFDILCACDTSKTEAVFVHSAGHAQDSAAAQRVICRNRIRLAIPDQTSHSPFLDDLAEGRFHTVLRTLLEGDADAMRAIGSVTV